MNETHKYKVNIINIVKLFISNIINNIKIYLPLTYYILYV